MEDNLHKKLLESEELYGDYKMPHDALDKYRKYESRKIKPAKIGLYKYISGFMILAFIISNAYWINNSMKTEEKLTIDTQNSTLDLSSHKKEDAPKSLDENSANNLNNKERVDNSKNPPINKTNVSQQDIIEQENRANNISNSVKYNNDIEEEKRTSSESKSKIRNYESKAKHSTLATEKTVSNNTSQEEKNSGIESDEIIESQKSHQSNVQANDLPIEVVSNEKLQLPKLMARQIVSISSIRKQKPQSLLSVSPFQKTKPIVSKLKHKFSLGLNYSWVNQTTNKYPSLNGKRIGIKGGMAITNQLRSRINLSLLHQDGNIKTIGDMPLYGLSEIDLPAGSSFEKLNFDRFAIGTTLGLDYYFNNFDRVRPFIGGHYHLEASKIQDIHSFHKTMSTENVKTVLPDAKLKFNNYVGLMTGIEMSVWRNISLSLELQYFQSLAGRENSFYSLGIGTSYRF